MKAALHREHGAVDVLRVEEIPEPVVGDGDVLLAVKAAGLNRLDVLQREGPPLIPGFRLPHIAGMDVAGEVVAVGRFVEHVEVGDRVLVNPALHCGECTACRAGDDGLCPKVRVVGGNHPGGYAQCCAVPATHVYRIPDVVSYEEAATVPTIWSTAWHALITAGKLRLGETVMIHAAGSGVSIAAIQLAKRCGATVVATSSSDDKLAMARELGADVVINHRTADVVGGARAASGGRGVDVVFDHVGPALFQQSLLALRPRGRMLFCGTTTGIEATFNLPYAYHFGMTLIGVDPYSFAEFERMLAHYWAGGYRAVVDSVFALDEVKEAQRRMEHNECTGKILLRP